MNPVLVITAAGASAATTFFLDPRAGGRRRALLRDRMVHLVHATLDVAETTSRDVANRTRGLVARVRSALARGPVSDDLLTRRVRSQIGFAVRHPGSVEVAVKEGRVTLTGPVLGDELERLLRRVAAVPGVSDVEDGLAVYDDPDGVPGLQGAASPRWGAHEFAWMQTHWSPGVRLLAGLAGGALALAGLARRDLLGAAITIPGAALLARALTNRELRRLRLPGRPYVGVT